MSKTALNEKAALMEAAGSEESSISLQLQSTKKSNFPEGNSRENLNKKSFCDLEQECLSEMATNELPFDGQLVSDGKIHRYSCDRKKNESDEFYAAFQGTSDKGNPYLNVFYGTWGGGYKTFTYHSFKKDKSFTKTERESTNKESEVQKKRIDQEIAKEKEKGVVKAKKEWENASNSPNGAKAYLDGKMVGVHAVRFGVRSFNDGTEEIPVFNDYDTILVPLKTIDGEFLAVQYIRADGIKRITGAKKGAFHQIGDITSDSVILVAEGYSTGVSAYEVIEEPTVIAVDCGNILPVVEALRKKYPKNRIIILGDDDIESEGNPGRTKAETAAKRFGCGAAFPTFPKDFILTDGKRPTDWNDLRVHFGVEEVRKQLQSCQERSFQDAWGEIIPFADDLLPVPKFDPELLPCAFGSYVLDASERIQCPPEFVAIGLLVVFSSIIGAGCAIRPHRIGDWPVIPNLWGAIIGVPSAKKSPALNVAMAPLAGLEKIAESDFKESKASTEVDKQEMESRKKVFKTSLEKAIKDGREEEVESIKGKLILLEKESSSAKCKRYKTNDTTVEKLQELLADNPRGLLQYNDELMGFLASLEKEGREGTRAFYLEAWNGWSKNRYQTDRIIRGSISCNPCISVLGAIQPSKLRIYLRTMLEGIGNDGFIQRFQLLVYPDPLKEWKLVDRHPDRAVIKQIEEMAALIASTDFLSLGAKMEEDFPLPVFRFTSEAQTLFHEWLTRLENRLIKLGEGLIPQHLSKYRSLVPSISLIFYLSRAAISEERSGISREDVEMAIKLSEFLEAHARRVYSMIDRRGIFAAKVLLEKICEGELKDGFTQRDVYRPQWSDLTNQPDVNDALSELVDRRYVVEEKIGPTPEGGRPTIKYRIHPEILKTSEIAPDKTKLGKEC
jgi:putative DNA primase/helicase